MVPGATVPTATHFPPGQVFVGLTDGQDYLLGLQVDPGTGMTEATFDLGVAAALFDQTNGTSFIPPGSVPGDPIFADGFESGNTTAWSNSVPLRWLRR